MTQEEKARAYDEALEVMRQWIAPCHTKEQLDTLKKSVFPELNESEDERIRKKLVEYHSQQFEKNRDQEIGLFHKDALAWLKKQKEQIPYIDFVIKPHKGDDNNPYDMRVSEAQEYAIKRGFGIPFNDGEVYVDERHMTQTIGNIIRWADEHPKEQKQEWQKGHLTVEDIKTILDISFWNDDPEKILEEYNRLKK